MLFHYKAVANSGEEREGEIDALNNDLAIGSLQKRGLVVVSISAVGAKKSFSNISFFQRVTLRDTVVLSRQIAALFEAQVPVLKAFQMLSADTENLLLRQKLTAVTDDVQAGLSISSAMAKHPDAFSDFYVNMVRAGEESGKLSQTFQFLSDYLDRYYELTSKTKNALIYPAFIIVTFAVVMILMLTMVIPKLSDILKDSGQVVPLYTKIVIGISDFFVSFGPFILIALACFGFYFWRFQYQRIGKDYIDRLKLSTPFIKELYSKLYLSRIADNLDTMLTSGISAVRALEISSTVVGNQVMARVLSQAAEDVKSGVALSDAFYKHQEIPNIMVQMVKVGEETGELSTLMRKIASFYKREVDNTVDTLVSLIEPVLIVFLGVSVGVLLASVLIPIYNIASTSF